MSGTLWGAVWSFFWYAIPWWAKAGGALAAVGYLYFVWRVPPRWLLVAAAIVAAALGYNQAAQKGWRAKEQRDMRDADKLIEKARQARVQAERVPVENRRDDDGFRRD